MSCDAFFQAKRPLVDVCRQHGPKMPGLALVLMDPDHDEYMRDRAQDLGVSPLLRAESDCGAACIVLSRDSLCWLLEGAGGDVEVARAALQHSSGSTPLLILHAGELLLVQPGVKHATA